MKVSVSASEEYSRVCAQSSSYGISADGLTLTVRWSSGGSRTAEPVELAEFPDRVEVGAVEKAPNGADTNQGFDLEAAVTLSAPLGGRAVIDAATGKALRLSGPDQGDLPLIDRVAGAVVVRVVARRADHAAYFAARYGPRVRTELAGERYECLEPL